MNAILKDVAMVLTECDLKKFNQYLIVLNHPSIPAPEKQEAAILVKTINSALKTLRNNVSERDFGIFYNYYFGGQNRNDIASALNVDATTIGRNKIKVLGELSVILYPNLNFLDMFV